MPSDEAKNGVTPIMVGSIPTIVFHLPITSTRSTSSFGPLRVINEDRVACRKRGSARTPHRDMEIISYVLDGRARAQGLACGNGSVIRPGDVQRMSAGSGVRHSEFNPSSDRAGCTSCRSGSSRTSWASAQLRREAFSVRREARTIEAHRLGGRRARIGDDSSGRQALRRSVRWRGASHTRARPGAAESMFTSSAGRSASMASHWAGAMRSRLRTRRPWSSMAAARPKCWCSTCRMNNREA